MTFSYSQYPEAATHWQDEASYPLRLLMADKALMN